MVYIDASIQGYSRIPPTIQKSTYKFLRSWKLFWSPRDRVLLATIRNFGSCPCPRCLVPKSKIPEVGTASDERRREKSRRVDDFNRNLNVSHARDLIYERGFGVKSAAVERLLAEESYTPTKVRHHTFKLLTDNESLHSRTHFQHLLPSVSTFLTCWYRILCMNLNSAYGRLFLRTLSVFWSHTVTVQSKSSIDDIGRFQPLEGPLFAASLKMRQEWRSWLREISRICSRCVRIIWNLDYLNHI